MQDRFKFIKDTELKFIQIVKRKLSALARSSSLSNIARYDVERGTKRNVEIVGNIYMDSHLLDISNNL